MIILIIYILLSRSLSSLISQYSFRVISVIRIPKCIRILRRRSHLRSSYLSNSSIIHADESSSTHTLSFIFSRHSKDISFCHIIDSNIGFINSVSSTTTISKTCSIQFSDIMKSQINITKIIKYSLLINICNFVYSSFRYRRNLILNLSFFIATLTPKLKLRIRTILSSKFTIKVDERISTILLNSLHHLILSLSLRHNFRSHLHSLITVNILHGFNEELSKFFITIEVTLITVHNSSVMSIELTIIRVYLFKSIIKIIL